MKITKKILSSLLVVVMCLTCAPLQGFVALDWSWLDFSVKASAATEGNYIYEVENGEATITNVSDRYGLSGDVVIPDTLGGYPVTAIGNYAFSSCDNIKSITIPDSVKSIDDEAFYSCDNLESVTIGDGLTTIGDKAFYYCNNFTTFIVSENNNNYSSDSNGVLFNKDKTELVTYPVGKASTTYTIPDSVITIGDNAFANCSNFESITIGDSVTTIGNSAFDYCASLTSITVDKNNTNYSSDSKGVLFNKDKTELVRYPEAKTIPVYKIPDSVTTIGYNAFKHCNNLMSVTIGDAVTSIGDNVFESCYNLESVIIGDGVTSIGDNMFNSCYNLMSVTIGASVTTIGDNAFATCFDLAEIKVSSNNPCFSSEKGILLNKDKTELIRYPRNKEQTSSYEIPDSVTTIGEYAFYYCRNLTNITIPDSVKEIGEGAFSWCGIKEITIPGSVTVVSDKAFYDCDYLTSVTIENGVKTIGSETFNDCNDLYDIMVPDSVTSIGENAFESQIVVYCNENSYIASYAEEKGIKHVIIDNEETVTGTVENITWKIDKKTGLLEISGSGDMPDFSYDNVPWSEYRYYVTSVKLAEGITKIGAFAFYNFYRIKNVVIPEGVTTIGEAAFGSCDSLTSITIPASVTAIGESAFSECESLRKVNITDVAAWCAIDFETYYASPFINFYNDLCVTRTNLYLNNELVKDLIIPDGVTTIKPFAFLGCGFSTVSIPESVTAIGKCAFAISSNLMSITVDENNQYYSSDEFGVLFNKDKTELIQFPMQLPITDIDNITDEEYYDMLTNGTIEYTIPDTVKVIGDGAFLGCVLLKSLNIPDGLTTIGDWAFGANSSLMLHLYIPGSVIDFGDNSANLVSVELGEGVTSIDYEIADFVRTCQNILIPKTVTKIKWDFFSDYGNFEEIFYSGTEEQWNNIELSDADKEYLEDVNIHFNVVCDSHKYNSELFYEPSCVTDGAYKHTCENCGWYYYEYCFDFDVHNMSEWSDFVPATCTATGVEMRYCTSGCGHYETRETKITNHTYNKVVTEPTCQTQGYTTYTCSDCGYSYVGDYVGGKTHNYTSTLTRPATHLSEGVRTYTCGTCGDSYTEAIPKTKEHSYAVSKVVAPTCEGKGYTVYVCECGDSYDGDKKAATGHSYDGDNCRVCGESKIENCTCKCHKGGIAGFFWKIGNFFNKLFKVKSKQFCACGIAHF